MRIGKFIQLRQQGRVTLPRELLTYIGDQIIGFNVTYDKKSIILSPVKNVNDYDQELKGGM